MKARMTMQIFPGQIFEHRCMVAGAKQLVHWFLGGKGLGIQQGTSAWVGSPKLVHDMKLIEGKSPSELCPLTYVYFTQWVQGFRT